MIRGGRADARPDPRVQAVLEVLRGDAPAEVAQRWAVDVALVHRWVRAFVEAGTAQVTNTPAEDAARQRDRFLAAFAHELRTPLAVARGWVDMLTDEDVPPAALQRTVGRLQESLERLQERLIDAELLAAASLGRLRVERTPVRVADLIATFDGPDEVPGGDVPISVDPTHFARVLRHLWWAANLDPEPRTVRIEVRDADPWVEVRVVRDADPIDPAVLQALFEPFDVNDDGSGVTFGLYVARALVVAHGGTLGVDQDDDEGCFWVRVRAH